MTARRPSARLHRLGAGLRIGLGLIAAAGMLLNARPSTAGDTSTAHPSRVGVQERLTAHGASSNVAQAQGSQAWANIVGGWPSAESQWPFQVALVNPARRSNYRGQFCAGTLISAWHVLTAAHCAQEFGYDKTRVAVLVGTQNLLSGGQRITVSQVQVHPAWNAITLDADVAVLRLAQPVREIAPVGFIRTLAEEARISPPGTQVYTLGWGDLVYQGGVYPALLQEVVSEVQPRHVCARRNAYGTAFTTTMLCVGPFAGGQGACLGDSGGAVLAFDPETQTYRQVGVVSWGTGCAWAHYPDVDSRLGRLGKWVHHVVQAAEDAGFK